MGLFDKIIGNPVEMVVGPAADGASEIIDAVNGNDAQATTPQTSAAPATPEGPVATTTSATPSTTPSPSIVTVTKSANETASASSTPSIVTVTQSATEAAPVASSPAKPVQQQVNTSGPNEVAPMASSPAIPIQQQVNPSGLIEAAPMASSPTKPVQQQVNPSSPIEKQVFYPVDRNGPSGNGNEGYGNVEGSIPYGNSNAGYVSVYGAQGEAQQPPGGGNWIKGGGGNVPARLGDGSQDRSGQPPYDNTGAGLIWSNQKRKAGKLPTFTTMVALAGLSTQMAVPSQTPSIGGYVASMARREATNPTITVTPTTTSTTTTLSTSHSANNTLEALCIPYPYVGERPQLMSETGSASLTTSTSIPVYCLPSTITGTTEPSSTVASTSQGTGAESASAQSPGRKRAVPPGTPSAPTPTTPEALTLMDSESIAFPTTLLTSFRRRSPKTTDVAGSGTTEAAQDIHTATSTTTSSHPSATTTDIIGATERRRRNPTKPHNPSTAMEDRGPSSLDDTADSTEDRRHVSSLNSKVSGVVKARSLPSKAGEDDALHPRYVHDIKGDQAETHSAELYRAALLSRDAPDSSTGHQNGISAPYVPRTVAGEPPQGLESTEPDAAEMPRHIHEDNDEIHARGDHEKRVANPQVRGGPRPYQGYRADGTEIPRFEARPGTVTGPSDQAVQPAAGQGASGVNRASPMPMQDPPASTGEGLRRSRTQRMGDAVRRLPGFRRPQNAATQQEHVDVPGPPPPRYQREQADMETRAQRRELGTPPRYSPGGYQAPESRNGGPVSGGAGESDGRHRQCFPRAIFRKYKPTQWY